MPPSDRTHVDRYQLRAALGSGGMGKVWRAFDPRLERDVAVKEVHLPEGMSAQEQENLKARMFREAKAAARVPHPSVVTVYDTLEDDGVPFIVMELLDGTSLQERLATSGPLTAPEIDRITAQLLGAMRAAQRSGVVHRDIKPANIMLADDGQRAVLTDFGIANLLDSETASLTQTGSILGTAEYVAPERLEHTGATAPAIASDLWSLGATLFAAATGASPFRRDSIAGTLTAVVGMPVPPFPLPARTAAVVHGLLVRDPRERLTVERAMEVLHSGNLPAAPQSAGQVPETAPHHAGSTTHLPHPRGPAPSPGQPPAPEPDGPRGDPARRALLWIGAAVVAVIVVGTALWVIPTALPEQDEEDASASGSEGDEITEYTEFRTEEVFLRHPAGWVPEDLTDELAYDEGAHVTLLSHHDIVAPEGDHEIRVFAYNSENELDAEFMNAYHLDMEESLGSSDENSAVERIRLNEEPSGRPPWSASVLELTYSSANWDAEERWFLSQHFVNGNNGMVLEFYLPEEDQDEYEQMVWDVIASLAPLT